MDKSNATKYVNVTLVFTMLLTGCTIKYPVVGHLYHYNEVLKGTVDHNPWTGTATVQGVCLVSGVEGRGTSYITYIPPWGGIKGQRGKVVMEYEDGRRIEVDWVAESLTAGFGTGQDQFGNRVSFKFGGTEKEGAQYVFIQLEKAKNRPQLPVCSVNSESLPDLLKKLKRKLKQDVEPQPEQKPEQPKEKELPQKIAFYFH